jgi:hypothetical protein
MDFDGALAALERERRELEFRAAVQDVAWWRFNRGWLYDVIAATDKLARQQREERARCR